MKIDLGDGVQLECTADELVDLKAKGFFKTQQAQPRQKAMTRHVDLKRKHFSKHEDKMIKEVWKNRKNRFRLTSKEYDTLENMLPNRTRKMIGARLFRMRRKHKIN